MASTTTRLPASGTTTTTTTAATTITTTTATTSTDALYRLLSWLSPAYPVGAYTYSHGLEAAVEEGAVRDRGGLVAYVATALRDGAGRVDGALLAAAHRAMERGRMRALDEAAELGMAWRGTAETALEATQQGGSFALVTLAVSPDPRFAAFAARQRGRLTHAVAFGAAAGMAGIPRHPALLAYLQGFAANLVSAGVRLVPLGQTDGQRVTAALWPVIARAAEAAEATPLDDLATALPWVEMLSMRHETQYTRLFRS